MVVDAVAPISFVAAGGIADGWARRGAVSRSGWISSGNALCRKQPISPAPQYQASNVGNDGRDALLSEIPDVALGKVWPGNEFFGMRRGRAPT